MLPFGNGKPCRRGRTIVLRRETSCREWHPVVRSITINERLDRAWRIADGGYS